MKTCKISRIGAYGDVLHCSHLPKLIKEYYKVDKLDFETSSRGFEILFGNPYIDKLTVIDMKSPIDDLVCRWTYAEDEYDLFFSLVHTIELNYCVLENDHRYWRNSKYRRERFGKMNYYDVMTEACNLPESYFGTRGHMYYEQWCHDQAKQSLSNIKKKHNADWLILVCLSGSSMHKRFQQAESVCKKILDKYPNSFIILIGDNDCKSQEFEHERVLSKIGKWNFRTTALMAKYIDFVISPETGLVCISHMWDTPTLQLLTAASWENHIKYAKNAYWVQSDIYCSPCHKSPHFYYGCPTRDNLPACIYFNEDKIMAKVEEAYVNRPVAT